MLRGYLYNLATDKEKGRVAAVLKAFLFCLSLAYGLGVAWLVFCSRLKKRKLGAAVLSVGNITLGGTGKTVLVEHIARYLREAGHKVAILSRGYKKVVRGPWSGARSQEAMGDEPYMLSKKLGDIPVIVDADRARGAKKAGRDFAADTLILDDGFQQWKIEKNLEIVCVDARNPFGNRRLLPRGILREPLSALKRAQIFVLTKTNLNPQTEAAANLLRKINPQALVCTAIHNPAGFYNLNKPAPLLALDSLRSQTVASICGIADPAGFEDLIASLGIKAGLTFRFPDHHQYTQDDLAKVMRACQEKNINAIITTEKDAAKFYQLPITDYQLPIFVLCIEIKITGNEQEFHRRLLSLYSG